MKKNCVKAFFLTATIIFMNIPAQAAGEKLVPLGKTCGIQIYTDGLLVIGTASVNGSEPARESGIKVNDRITAINGSSVDTSEKFAQTVNEHPEGVTLDIVRDNREITVNAVPALSEDDIYRLGLWVRDSCAGVGTITYYNPDTNNFAALGHSINDVDTGDILSCKDGCIVECDIVSVTKSSRGLPGEINAAFGSKKLGDITCNSENGIFGEYENLDKTGEAIPVASRDQIHEGDAYILSDILGENTQKYSVRINNVSVNSDKELVIEITDDRIINSCGGIVQGMSGSPIIQNGRLVGAVTHVLVNSPLKGYGTLAESMIDTERKLQ